MAFDDSGTSIAGMWQECVAARPLRGKGLIYVDGAKLRLVSRAVRWTRVTLKRISPGVPLVFWDDRRAVALLMPLRTGQEEPKPWSAL